MDKFAFILCTNEFSVCQCVKKKLYVNLFWASRLADCRTKVRSSSNEADEMQTCEGTLAALQTKLWVHAYHGLVVSRQDTFERIMLSLLQRFTFLMQSGVCFKVPCRSGRWTGNDIYFFGWIQSDNTETTTHRYNFIFVYLFKIAAAIVFLCINALEAVLISFISIDFELKLLLQHFFKKTQ